MTCNIYLLECDDCVLEWKTFYIDRLLVFHWIAYIEMEMELRKDISQHLN